MSCPSRGLFSIGLFYWRRGWLHACRPPRHLDMGISIYRLGNFLLHGLQRSPPPLPAGQAGGHAGKRNRSRSLSVHHRLLHLNFLCCSGVMSPTIRWHDPMPAIYRLPSDSEQQRGVGLGFIGWLSVCLLLRVHHFNFLLFFIPLHYLRFIRSFWVASITTLWHVCGHLWQLDFAEIVDTFLGPLRQPVAVGNLNPPTLFVGIDCRPRSMGYWLGMTIFLLCPDTTLGRTIMFEKSLLRYACSVTLSLMLLAYNILALQCTRERYSTHRTATAYRNRTEDTAYPRSIPLTHALTTSLSKQHRTACPVAPGGPQPFPQSTDFRRRARSSPQLVKTPPFAQFLRHKGEPPIATITC
ncbi:hypothetical protein K491DRAFT_464242 [Lophiostoma macrostomum CBS 122681]|uniref:Uncharacterized protein n=1 Tax=Lophiostoma macrostomum CBS 122681 TaxID=1314788 RepID=A0A6A6T6Q3_9PLEO|nr:hypothetical protein K491DRAFT_464242 [Lophiostoma macrostomum CBS 122681]